MYLYVSSLALDILTLSAPSFVTQDRSIEKEQRLEIKEVKESIRCKDTYTKNQPARGWPLNLRALTIFYVLNKEQYTHKGYWAQFSPFEALINKIYLNLMTTSIAVWEHVWKSEFKGQASLPPGRTATCRITTCAQFLPTMHRGLCITVIGPKFEDISQLLQW